MTVKHDDTCSSCNQGYEFAPNTKLHIYLGYIRATNVEATCPHCNEYQLIFVAYENITRYVYHAQIKVLVHYDPHPDFAERADRAWDVDKQRQELPEVPRTWSRELYDTFRQFGGES
jgi:hypothetical protein